MARINSYPTISPASDDLVLITDTSATDNPTKTATISSILDLDSGYTVYTALITQSLALAPVVTVLKNTTGGTIAWTRQSTGIYVATISNATYTANKTAVILTLGGNNDNILKSVVDSTTAISLYNINSQNGNATDTVAATTTVEIRIYS